MTRITLPDDQTDFSWYLRAAVCAVVQRQDGSLWLQTRPADAGQTKPYLGLFGGGIEAGETVWQALQRELREELGSTCAAADCTFLYAEEKTYQDKRHFIARYLWRDTAGAITGCYEETPVAFASTAEALADPWLSTGTREALEECLRRGLLPA